MKKLFAILMSIMMIACFMPSMAFAEGATASVGNVTINGTVGTALEGTNEVTITLTNEKFVAMNADDDVAAWFTNLPTGLEAKIKANVDADATEAIITISGTPTVAKAEAIAITIPAEKVAGDAAVTVTENADAKYAIAAKPAPAASATVANVTINGTVGTALEGTNEVTITLTNEKFVAMNADDDVAAWFTNLPTGLEAKIKANVDADATEAIITISGTPTVAKAEAIAITIPAEKVAGTDAVTVTENAEAKYAIVAASVPAASATVDNVTISGKTGTAIAGQDVVITLNGDTFKAMDKDADVKDWFTNLPAGLDAKIKEAVREGATKVTVTIGGKPTATSSAALAIKISGNKLNSGAAVTVNANTNAKYNITAPSTGSGGGSYYPYTPSTPSKPSAPNLDKTKTDSTTALNAAATANKYDAAEQAEVKKILDKANADIKNAKTEAEVKAIEEAAQAEIDKILTTEEKAIVAALDNVEKRDFATKSKVITRKGGKKVIRLTWTAPDGVDVDGYEIFRSTKKNSGFGKKPYFTTSNTSYTNTKALKAGKTYYYKVRAFVVINGERVYTDYSLKANRKL